MTNGENQNVFIHCRGGIGRAGLVASCLLLFIFKIGSYKKAIEGVRKRRDKRCVESRKQEDFVKVYEQYVKELYA